MAKIPRKTQKVFAGSASNNGVIGSAQDGTKVLSNDLATLQSKAAFLQGFNLMTLTSRRLTTLEELQALHYMHTTQNAYILQEGISEYDSGSTYFINSIVKKPGTYQLFGSVTDNNTGNALPTFGSNNANWTSLKDLASVTAAPNRTFVSNNAFASLSVLPYDDTPPQIGEGTQILTGSLTPSSATARFRVRYTALLGSGAANNMTGAIFINGAASTVSAKGCSILTGGTTTTLVDEYEYVPGSTTLQTITVRAGQQTGNGYVNGTNAGTAARVYGGTSYSTLVIEEISP